MLLGLCFFAEECRCILRTAKITNIYKVSQGEIITNWFICVCTYICFSVACKTHFY